MRASLTPSARYALEKPRQISIVPPPAPIRPPPNVVPPPPAPPAPGAFYSPGLDFSVIIPSYTPQTFGQYQQSSLCAAITSGWATADKNPGAYCTVGSVLAFDSTRVLVSGYAFFTFQNQPSQAQLASVTSLRDGRVTALTTSINTVLGASFPLSVPNCGCYGLDTVTQPASAAYEYNINVAGVPGPMVCGARLIYTETTDPNVGFNVVGVDTSTGKYCSTPAITGGVVGVPSTTGSCRQYGVLTEPVGPPPAVATATVASGTVTTVTLTAGGSGYITAPTVTISAPNPLAAQIAATVGTSGAGAGQLSMAPTPGTVSNGPYIGPLIISSYTGATCIDTSSTGTAVCSGASGSITVLSTTYTGPTCTGMELAPTGIPVSAAGVFVGPFNSNPAILCDAVPAITLATIHLQSPGVQATATAAVTNGAVTSITLAAGSTGYRTAPQVSFSPAGSALGKLCSPNPITSLPPTVAYNIPTMVSRTGVCQPLGRDTYQNNVCSSPAAPLGVPGILNVYTCNVQSSFLAQYNSQTSFSCGIVPQVFLSTSIPVDSPPPPAPPTPPQSPPPSPDTTVPPPPPPPAPIAKTCKWVGSYMIESAACPGKYIAFNTDPETNNGCTNSTLMLRTTEQSPGKKKIWQFDGSYTVGKTPVASGIIAIGRLDSCPKTQQTNMGANDGTPKPRLAGDGWKFKIIPVDATSTCSEVYFQLVGNSKYAGKYVAQTNCKDQGAFAWAQGSTSNTVKWALKATPN